MNLPKGKQTDLIELGKANECKKKISNVFAHSFSHCLSFTRLSLFDPTIDSPELTISKKSIQGDRSGR